LASSHELVELIANCGDVSYLLYLVKELTRRKGRTATNLLVVAVLVIIFVVLTSVINAYSQAIYLPFQDVGVDLIIKKSAPQSVDAPTTSIRLPFGQGVFDQNEIDRIAASNYIEDVSKTLVLWQFDKGKFISIEGLEPNSFIGKKYGSWVTAGRFLQAGEDDKVVVEKHFARFYGLNLGDSLSLGNTPFEVIGIVSTQEQSQIAATNLYVNLPDAQMLLDTKGYSQLYVNLDNLSSEDTVRSEVSHIDKDAVVVSGTSIGASVGNVVKIYEKFHLLALALIAIILTLILFQVNATSLIERRKDIGILQTVGWTKANISRQIVSEIFVQSIFGFVLGIILSILILAGIGSISIQVNAVQGLGNNLSTLTAPLLLSFAAIAQFFILTLATSTIVSFFLSRQLACMKPLINLKN
jgi:putative ABC transport system permease protein